MKRDLIVRSAVFGVLVAIAVAVRLWTPLPNFGAVTAATLFAGFYFRNRATAACLPLVAMVASDYFLGGYAKGVMLVVYAACLIPILWRRPLRNHLSPLRVGAGAVSSGLAYFLVTNLAVWYAWYERTWAGLVECYALALPFRPNALLGDLLFAGAFFGVYALAQAFGRADMPAVDAT